MTEKKSGCGLFGCATFVGLLALAGIALLRQLPPETAVSPPPVPPDTLPPPSSVEPESGPLPERRVRQDSTSFHLTFYFRDPEGRPRELFCTIRRSDYERERASFGFVEAQRVEELNRSLRQFLAREAAARGVASYFTIEVHDQGSIRWSWTYPGGADAETVERIKAFHRWLEEEASDVVEAIEGRFYRAHGMRLEGNTYSIDYETLAHNATAPLADCFTALRRSDVSGSPLGLFLTFFQDLRYEIPRNVDEEGRETLGFRVPTAVLVEGAGDCDSKSVAFCAMWRQMPARVLVVRVPGHALVAVEGKPGPGQASVRLGNRYFILCEVAGPGRSRPGQTNISGSFEYVLIEPA